MERVKARSGRGELVKELDGRVGLAGLSLGGNESRHLLMIC